MATVAERIQAVDWERVTSELVDIGYARLGLLLTDGECEGIERLWSVPRRFRKSVEMARLRFGVGEYRYFAAPLPRLVGSLRRALYPPLARLAPAVVTGDGAYPSTLDEFRSQCARASQDKPTPLLLRYGAGGYNRLHRDLYGRVAFPLQVVVNLSRPGVDFEGGEFLLVENHARAQSIGHAVALRQGEALVFPTAERAAPGKRGPRRVGVRHGLSRVTSGTRFALGIIFHDAE